jgi:hypothetical protein
MSVEDFKTKLKTYAGIDSDRRFMSMGNVVVSDGITAVTMTADRMSVDNMTAQSVTTDHATAVSLTADHMTARYFRGSGKYITDVEATVPSILVADLTGNVTSSGTVSAKEFMGDGSKLTGIGSSSKVTAPNFRACQSNVQALSDPFNIYAFDAPDTDEGFDNTWYNHTDSNITVQNVIIPPFSFKPNIAGYYMIGAQTRLSRTMPTAENAVVIYKNGKSYATGSDIRFGYSSTAPLTEPNHNYSSTVSSLVYLNGNTDYVSAYIYVSAKTETDPGNHNGFSWFNGILINQGTITV